MDVPYPSCNDANVARAFRAAWVWTGDALLNNAAIVTRGRRLQSIGAWSGASVDLGDALIVPGFVNAHLHIDLAPLVHNEHERRPTTFGDWLHAVVRQRRATGVVDQETLTQRRRDAIAEVLAGGAAVVGDIAGGDDVLSAWRSAGLAGIAFLEVVGRRPQRHDPLWAQAERACHAHDIDQTIGPRVGVSPHAPYSTAPTVFARSGGLGAPRATHWLESPEEREFLATGGGPLRDFMNALGAMEEPPPTGIADPWSAFLDHDGPPWTLAHANMLTPAEIARLADPKWRERVAGVVYCPRTHAYFGLPPHPWQQLRAAGVPVGLGTDSRASNPDLSIFAEARWLAHHSPDIAPAVILGMLTRGGAAALGLGNAGRLVPDADAHLTVLAGAWPSDARNVLATVFEPSTKVAAVMSDGVWRWTQPTLADRLVQRPSVASSS